MCIISLSRSSTVTRRRRGDATDRKSNWAGLVIGPLAAHGLTWSSSRFEKLAGSGRSICLFAIQPHTQHAGLWIDHKVEAYGGITLCRSLLQSRSMN